MYYFIPKYHSGDSGTDKNRILLDRIDGEGGHWREGWLAQEYAHIGVEGGTQWKQRKSGGEESPALWFAQQIIKNDVEPITKKKYYIGMDGICEHQHFPIFCHQT